MLKLLGVAVAGLAFAALALPAAAGQVQRVSTEVQLWGADEPDTGNLRARGDLEARFFGRVFAGKAKCAKFRRLTLFGDDEGPDVRVGAGVSDSRGYWSIHAPVVDVENGFYATTPKARRGKRTVCKADRSPTVQLAF